MAITILPYECCPSCSISLKKFCKSWWNCLAVKTVLFLFQVRLHVEIVSRCHRHALVMRCKTCFDWSSIMAKNEFFKFHMYPQSNTVAVCVMQHGSWLHSVMVWLQLYNVVVETEQVGKKLLEKGELKRRVTIIPLNKIASTTINNDAVKRAESLVSIVACLLLNCVI